jgi:hypothetical protein
MDKVHTCTCPACGNSVRLSRGVIGSRDRVEPERLDRLAHAACGCYVRTMPAGQVGRLLASVLVAGSDEDRLDAEADAPADS